MRAKIKIPNLHHATKRGDTIIEVMFALAVFSLVSVITISMMNLGTANAEGTLELTTARYELNAQAEALRYIHSAYTAELGLPACNTSTVNAGEKCQQYADLWAKITKQAKEYSDDTAQQHIIDITNTILGNNDSTTSNFQTTGCERVYEEGRYEGKSLLAANNAFVLNIRDLNIQIADDKTSLLNPDAALVSIGENKDKFTAAPLSARIIYGSSDTPSQTTEDGFAVRNTYNQVAKAEGIWVVAISGEPTSGSVVPFYDFYIQTCWNAPNAKTPTILDTVIRLYNPGAK